jgi:hypothetical protein
MLKIYLSLSNYESNISVRRKSFENLLFPAYSKLLLFSAMVFLVNLHICAWRYPCFLYSINTNITKNQM